FQGKRRLLQERSQGTAPARTDPASLPPGRVGAQRGAAQEACRPAEGGQCPAEPDPDRRPTAAPERVPQEGPQGTLPEERAATGQGLLSRGPTGGARILSAYPAVETGCESSQCRSPLPHRLNCIRSNSLAHRERGRG